ncbi:hypothetical protein B0I35DRAFT_510077 [Stachybotrys elegans]|uniref:Cytochrome c oxidase assembly protein COX20, mitochondrial n=1 Tax=Stachybotrys elegans TaxID=80388 RepID=A0A8K0SWA9_9HYPO|nr:hypothetical protein B0I35DRAFT_510077 [Stachybotrys elegans]
MDSGRSNGQQPASGGKNLQEWSTPLEHPAQGTGASSNAEALPPQSQPTLKEAFSTIKAEDFVNIGKVPCAKGGLMTGIGAGFGAGLLRAVAGGTFLKSGHWAVGTFVVTGTAAYEYCLYSKRQERLQLKRAIEIANEEKRIEAMEKMRIEAEQKRLKEEQQKQNTVPRSWWKFW